ncbi:Tfp pilus assembly protein FimT/FimU [Psychrobacter immobilis]|uniref:pilus assembly FimT family protein n=1 Tax=Psychrobacter immobilis TaxID=498 RepID=UPI001D110A3F|nr:GspH/FimT family pseudopilin [Psychrobacter immobilis]
MNASAKNVPYQLRMNSSGFTLIELMVTIAVLAIIVGIAAPSISTQLANQRVKSTAATLANALKEARVESVIRRQNITLSYNNTSTPKVITITAPSSTAIGSYSYNSSSTIKPATATTTVFEPSKRVTTARTYTICDSNEAASPQQIEVNALANISIKSGGSC